MIGLGSKAEQGWGNVLTIGMFVAALGMLSMFLGLQARQESIASSESFQGSQPLGLLLWDAVGFVRADGDVLLIALYMQIILII